MKSWWRTVHGAVAGGRRTGWRRGATVALSVVLVGTMPPATSLAQDGATAAPERGTERTTPPAAPGIYTVTLVTGDVVTVDHQPDGRVAVDVDPADRDGVPVSYETVTAGEDVYVFPSDVTSLVPETLDPELFNVTGLVRAGYHADDAGHLSVIVTYPESRYGAAASLPAGTTPLPSADAVALTLDEAQAVRFWRRTVTAGGAVEKVWLDAVHHVALDQTVPIVGAPGAWAAGYDGAGVTVAVLDTGVDATHPDLAGKVVDERNFTAEEDARDNHGHGTHVASIAAGTGAASGGDFTGTAPGAEVVNAKVCNENGSCPTSAIIAGMEWVASDLGIPVANMSIGTSTASDGTDPISQALNTLTEEYGTLFVVAAGNNGSRPTTVGSPGAADAALTVGNVFNSGFVSSSSSRGPRLGDFAIKPDITAPGTSVTAARAAGTSMGSPVDDFYTSASGTSMASPHVAGAAAILLQQNPGLTAAEVKAMLATTGDPHSSFDVYEQGGGVLDVSAAVDLPVLAAPAPVNLGYFPYPHDDVEPATRTVTYTNRTGDELSLALSLEVENRDGVTPAGGMLTLSADTVTLAGGEAATVDVTVDPRIGDYGLYGGYLVAEHDGTVVTRTPVGFHKEDERYGLTIRGIDTEGGPASGALTVINVEDQDIFFELSVPYDGAGEAYLRVPPGTYAIYGFADTHPEGETFATVRTAVAEPEITVTGETEVVFDARDAAPMTVDTPEHETAPRNRVGISLFREPQAGLGAIRGVQAFAEGTTFQALPSDEATIGYFELVSRWQLADPDDPVGTDVLYDVLLPEVGAIPADLDYEVRPEQLATLHQDFYNHQPDRPVAEVRHGWRPWQSSSIGVYEDVPAPSERTEYLSAADTASWTRNLDFAPHLSSFVGRMNEPRHEYPVGAELDHTWMKQPVTPGFLEGTPWHTAFPQFREGDVLDLFIPEFSDAEPGHWGFRAFNLDETAFRLYQDGELVAEDDRASGTWTLDPEPSRVRVELDVARDADWWRYSTRTSTAWEFTSAHAPAFISEIVAPEVRPLDLEYMSGSPELAEPLAAPVVSAGIGRPEDFEGVDADGAVVFMQRGGMTFAAKAQNAADAGAVAAVVYNSFPGGFSGSVGSDGVIPTYSLSMEQGLEVVDLVEREGDVTIELTPGELDVVPMLLVDYDVTLDLLNRAPHPDTRTGPQTVEIQVRHQSGFDSLPVPGRPAIEDARLWISYDDGETWRERPAQDLGDGKFRYRIDSRDPEETNGFVSLRVEAWDVEGNRIQQEVIRAWGLTPR